MALSLASVTARAQRDANHENRSMAVLNLNPHFAALYVIRLWDDRMADHNGRGWTLVARIDPKQPLSAADIAARQADYPKARD